MKSVKNMKHLEQKNKVAQSQKFNQNQAQDIEIAKLN
jgi:hypothetical protein